ncbi:hypothetical protein A2967_01780 [Candidatus Daviesbacteria bacterium RIFCSPLOWO2_01_FULL_41_32]|nr:MAG: hypothetical protein A2967_01780 [Candidatus Daviesbacteria bacterium RIFCSPLOWO2_01_FULL_41_32]
MAFSEFGPRIYRTLIEVVRVDAEKEMVHLVVPGWNPDATVTITVARIQPPELLEQVRYGGYLLAKLNLDAKEPAGLMLHDFTSAPKPTPETELR